jgi:hypothetical protein
MAYCSHCGRPTAGGRFCPACGSPIARGAVASVTAGLLRRHKQLCLMVAAFAVLFLVTAGFVVSRAMHMERSGVVSHPGENSVAAAQPAQQPMPPTQTPPGRAIAPYASTSQPQPPPPQAVVPSGSTPAVHPSSGSIDTQEVQRALSTLTQRSERRDSSPSSSSAESSSNPSGSDRYPGSQSVEVKDVNLPDIGVPIASEVYTTTDSIATVVDYYRQRYPAAEVTEVNGQKIVAVNQPGATKVIAIGTTGTETRIAIVQPVD